MQQMVDYCMEMKEWCESNGFDFHVLEGAAEKAIRLRDTVEKEHRELFCMHLIDVVSKYIYEDETVLSTETRKDLINRANETFNHETKKHR